MLGRKHSVDTLKPPFARLVAREPPEGVVLAAQHIRLPPSVGPQPVWAGVVTARNEKRRHPGHGQRLHLRDTSSESTRPVLSSVGCDASTQTPRWR